MWFISVQDDLSPIELGDFHAVSVACSRHSICSKFRKRPDASGCLDFVEKLKYAPKFVLKTHRPVGSV